MTATSTVLAEPPTGTLTESLRGVFAEVTRYPLEILEADALLEEDLGIDSVKLGEVFSVLRERYDLPEDLQLQPEQMSTISGLSTSLAGFLGAHPNGNGRGVEARGGNGHGGNGHGGNGYGGSGHGGSGHGGNGHASHPEARPNGGAPLPTPLSTPTSTPISAPLGAEPVSAAPSSPAPSASGPALLEQVRGVFAEVTRYPLEILEPEALLEEDLGIDSVKLGEVFAVLRERFDLPEEMGLQPEQLSTLSAITTSLETFLGTSAPAPSAVRALSSPSPAPALAAAPTPTAEAPTVVPNSTSAFVASWADHASPSTTGAWERPLPFAGKVAVITGSGRGLGKDIGQYLAGLGAKVVVNSFHSRDRGEATAAEIVEAGGEAHHIWGSVANPEHVDRMFDEVEERYGGIDFFISNASNGMLARLEDITPHHWEKAFRTNIIGLHQGAMRAAELMKKGGGGKIITLSSPASQGYVDYFGCMGAVKAAVESLTRSLAIELAPHDIQVNCVSPGPVYGELLDKWPDSERLIPQWEANTAYPRLCEARDVSHFIAYLLSEEVKLFTGSVLVIDGGISSQGW